MTDRKQLVRNAYLFAGIAAAAISLASCNTMVGDDYEGRDSRRYVDQRNNEGRSEPYIIDRTVLRAGPSRKYPIVQKLARNSKIRVHGCLDRRDWCDVSTRSDRGWVRADEIGIQDGDGRIRFDEFESRKRVETVRFGFDYWESNYRDRPWYRNQYEWERRYRTRD